MTGCVHGATLRALDSVIWDPPQTRHVGIGWATPDQVGYGCSRQQPGWVHRQDQKLDLVGEEDVLSVREEPRGKYMQFVPKELREGSSHEVKRSISQLKCLYTSAHRGCSPCPGSSGGQNQVLQISSNPHHNPNHTIINMSIYITVSAGFSF